MKHIYCFRKLSHVTDAVFHRGMNSDLLYARTNRRHRLAVDRLQPLLYLPELKAR
jgi:hypothetical protein